MAKNMAVKFLVEEYYNKVIKTTPCPECAAAKGQECITCGGWLRIPHTRRINKKSELI